MGRLALSEDAEGVRLRGVDSASDIYVRDEDYEAIHDSMFLTVELTKENFFDYFGPLQQVGYETDEFGKKTYPVWFTPSLAAENGLYVWDVSDDFALQYTCIFKDKWGSDELPLTEKNVPFSITSGPNTSNIKFKEIKQIKGTVTFIRQEFVASNTFDADHHARVLVLKDGTSHNLYCANWFWVNATCSYEDWAY